MLKRKSIISLIISLVLFTGFSCSQLNEIENSEEFISFDEFVEEFTIHSNDDIYYLEGDIKMNLEELQDYYNQRIERAEAYSNNSRATYEDWYDKYDNYDSHSIWNDTQKLNLKYFIDSSFTNTINNAEFYDGTRNIYNARATMISRMEEATEKWEETCNINFTRINDPSEADANDVVIKIYYEEYPLVYTGPWAYSKLYGSAFFPNEQYKSDDLGIQFTQFYLEEDNEHQRYTTIHELGHALGLRHEHMWTSSGSEPSNRQHNSYWYLKSVSHKGWIDTASIMYYNNYSEYSGDYDISSTDAETMEYLYGAPY